MQYKLHAGGASFSKTDVVDVRRNAMQNLDVTSKAVLAVPPMTNAWTQRLKITISNLELNIRKVITYFA